MKSPALFILATLTVAFATLPALAVVPTPDLIQKDLALVPATDPPR